MLAAALAILVPALAAPQMVPVSGNPFGFPEITISKADTEHEWPFSVDSGRLTCVTWGDQRGVIFAEPWDESVPQEFGNMTLPRSVIVSTNPMAILAGLEDRELFLPFGTFEVLIKRLAPFETMGLALCAKAEKTREL